MTKILEMIGTGSGVLGAFLVAIKLAVWGYPFFLVSSVALTYTAWRYNQKNLLVLQGVFLAVNVLGLFNYMGN
jgi:nicotinamide riboside transporter PnuC